MGKTGANGAKWVILAHIYVSFAQNHDFFIFCASYWLATCYAVLNLQRQQLARLLLNGWR